MRKILPICIIFLFVFSSVCNAELRRIIRSDAPTQVLSDVSYVDKRNVDAVRIDFSLPVHYVSHYLSSNKKRLTINIRFNKKEVPDLSQLPLEQTLFPSASAKKKWLKEVTYSVVSKKPKLVLTFNEKLAFKLIRANRGKSFVIYQSTKSNLKKSKKRAKKKRRSKKRATAKSSATKKRTLSKKRIEKLFSDANKALKKGKNKRAIQLFAVLVAVKKHKHSRDSLEFLGIARERNRQSAHAKSNYKKYIRIYPKGDKTIRVRQRLAELISSQLKPKRKLKASAPAKKGKNRTKTKFIGTWSQSWQYGEQITADRGREMYLSSIGNQLSLNWRRRSKDYELRHYFSANYDYDAINAESDDGLEVGSAYSRIKHSRLGFEATIGRQFANSGGIFGKFDGLRLGYRLIDSMNLVVAGGYPVDTTNKKEIQKQMPFYSVSVELNDFWKNWDIVPYYTEQNSEGLLNRRAIGSEINYFHRKGNVYNLVDFDILYRKLNIFLLQTQYNLKKHTSLNLNFGYQKSPFLETNNALMQLADMSLTDLQQSPYSLSMLRIQQLALDRTGYSSYLTFSLSHSFNKNNDVTANISRSKNKGKQFVIDNSSLTLTDLLQNSDANYDAQTEYGLQWVSKEIFHKRDVSILQLHYTDADGYNDWDYSYAYRTPFRSVWRLDVRLQLKVRKEDESNRTTIKQTPTLKLNYRASQSLRYYLEMSFEQITNKGGPSNQEVSSQFDYMYMGYSWNF